ncbi:MAG TPA: hypothetical protein VGJ88_11580 [Thermoanaerobaculia bacterium]
MTFSVAHSSRKLALLAILLVAATAYLAVLLRYNCWFAAGPDSAGYCTEAKMIASGHMMMEVPLLRELQLPPEMIRVFTPTGWMRAPVDGFMVPTYPAGVPLHQAILGKVFGWRRAPFLLAPIVAFLTIFVCVALFCDLGVPLPYACGGAMAYVLIPTFVEHAVQPVSDVVASFYCIVAIWLAFRASRVGPAILPGALSGVAFAIGVWVRPTNFLLVIALAFAMCWKPRALAAFTVAAAPIGLALAWWNKTLYGSPFVNGYGSLSSVMSPYPVSGAFHLRVVGEMLTPLVALAVLFVFFDRRVAAPVRTLIAVWFGSFLLFYSFYDFRDERFMLPAVPALIAGFLLVIERAAAVVGAYAPRFAQVVALSVILTVIGLEVHAIDRHHSLNEAREDSIYPTSIAFAEARLPKEAFVTTGLMAGAFLYGSNRFTFRFDVLPEGKSLAIVRAAAKRSHKRWYALLSVFEATPDRFDAWSPARWIPVGENGNVTLWRLECAGCGS